MFDIIFENQGAFRTLGEVTFADLVTAILRRAEKHRLAAFAEIFTFGFFFADRAFFHGTTSLITWQCEPTEDISMKYCQFPNGSPETKKPGESPAFGRGLDPVRESA